MTVCDISALVIMTAIISFLGFIVEDAWMLIKYGYIDNRNMYLPFLLGYGLLVVGMFVVFGVPDSPRFFGMVFDDCSPALCHAVYFLISFAVVSLGEIALGIFVEKVFGFEYWNYSDIPLHFTKYTSVPTSIGFALLITTFMGGFFEPIFSAVQRMPTIASNVIASILAAALLVDFFASFAVMFRNRSLNTRWRREISLNRKEERKNRV